MSINVKDLENYLNYLNQDTKLNEDIKDSDKDTTISSDEKTEKVTTKNVSTKNVTTKKVRSKKSTSITNDPKKEDDGSKYSTGSSGPTKSEDVSVTVTSTDVSDADALAKQYSEKYNLIYSYPIRCRSCNRIVNVTPEQYFTETNSNYLIPTGKAVEIPKETLTELFFKKYNIVRDCCRSLVLTPSVLQENKGKKYDDYKIMKGVPPLNILGDEFNAKYKFIYKLTNYFYYKNISNKDDYQEISKMANAFYEKREEFSSLYIKREDIFISPENSNMISYFFSIDYFLSNKYENFKDQDDNTKKYLQYKDEKDNSVIDITNLSSYFVNSKLFEKLIKFLEGVPSFTDTEDKKMNNINYMNEMGKLLTLEFSNIFSEKVEIVENLSEKIIKNQENYDTELFEELLIVMLESNAYPLKPINFEYNYDLGNYGKRIFLEYMEDYKRYKNIIEMINAYQSFIDKVKKDEKLQNKVQSILDTFNEKLENAILETMQTIEKTNKFTDDEIFNITDRFKERIPKNMMNISYPEESEINNKRIIKGITYGIDFNPLDLIYKGMKSDPRDIENLNNKKKEKYPDILPYQCLDIFFKTLNPVYYEEIKNKSTDILNLYDILITRDRNDLGPLVSEIFSYNYPPYIDYQNEIFNLMNEVNGETNEVNGVKIELNKKNTNIFASIIKFPVQNIDEFVNNKRYEKINLGFIGNLFEKINKIYDDDFPFTDDIFMKYNYICSKFLESFISKTVDINDEVELSMDDICLMMINYKKMKVKPKDIVNVLKSYSMNISKANYNNNYYAPLMVKDADDYSPNQFEEYLELIDDLYKKYY